MKKKKTRNNPTDELPKLVQVKSRTYGTHTRAARGTKTTAALNTVLGKNAANTRLINHYASTVYAILLVYCRTFKEGQLWQHILSRMRSAGNVEFYSGLSSLEGLELNSRYKLQRLVTVQFVRAEIVRKKLIVSLQQFNMPDNKKYDGYRYIIIMAFFNVVGACVYHDAQPSEEIPATVALQKFSFVFDKPAKAKYCLLCLHLQLIIKGEPSTVLAGNGMRVVMVKEL